VILLFERPIQRGDTVEVGGVMGDVVRINMRSSTVRTFDGAEVVVPNSHFISNQFTNWTLSDSQRRIVIPVGVAYGTNPEQVIEILTAEAKRHEHILEQPEPITIFIGFGESSLDFEIRAWTQRFDWRRIQSEIGLAIIHALDAAGIQIPFPQRDLHLRSVDPEAGGSLRSDPAAD
jgi:potassium efflux system protein